MGPYSKEEINLLMEEFDRVESGSARAAFMYLVTDAVARPAYSCRPGKHGHIYDFRYYYQEKWCYAFIPNKSSLLWYFRRPLLNEYAVDILSLQNKFGEVKITGSQEIAVRLNNFEDAQRITSYLL